MNYDDHIDDRVRYPFIHESEILKLYNKQTNKIMQNLLMKDKI